MSWTSRSDLERWFSLQRPRGDEGLKLDMIRRHALDFATVLLDLTPSNADQSHAFRLLRMSVQSAIAAVVCQRRPPEELEPRDAFRPLYPPVDYVPRFDPEQLPAAAYIRPAEADPLPPPAHGPGLAQL